MGSRTNPSINKLPSSTSYNTNIPNIPNESFEYELESKWFASTFVVKQKCNGQVKFKVESEKSTLTDSNIKILSSFSDDLPIYKLKKAVLSSRHRSNIIAPDTNKTLFTIREKMYVDSFEVLKPLQVWSGSEDDLGREAKFEIDFIKSHHMSIREVATDRIVGNVQNRIHTKFCNVKLEENVNTPLLILLVIATFDIHSEKLKQL